jgi:hypothetical protein
MVQTDRQQHPSILKTIFSFPKTINEYAARIVAGFIVVLSLSFLLSQHVFILYVLAYGFLARVLAGPTLSPIALLVTKIIIPKIGNPYNKCPGPPKRFAQFIGLIFTTTSIFLFLYGNIDYANILMSILTIFASLESIIGFCAGCWFFKLMMKWGWIPQSICEKCNNISYAIK